jgi:hypothetical protein
MYLPKHQLTPWSRTDIRIAKRELLKSLKGSGHFLLNPSPHCYKAEYTPATPEGYMSNFLRCVHLVLELLREGSVRVHVFHSRKFLIVPNNEV